MVDSVPVTTRCLPVVPHSMTATGVSSFFPACRKFSQIVGKFYTHVVGNRIAIVR